MKDINGRARWSRAVCSSAHGITGVVVLVFCVGSTNQRTLGSDVIATSPRDDFVATALDGGRIEIRRISSGDDLVTIQFEGVPALQERRRSAVSWIPSCVFSPKGTTLASCCGYLPVSLWDLTTGKLLAEFMDCGVGYRLRFSADGSRLIGSGIVNKAGLQRITLWNVKTGETLRQLTVDKSIMDDNWDRNSISPRFAKSGPMLVMDVIDGRERSLRVWNTASNKETMVVKTDRLSPPDWVISSDGKYLIMREYDRDTDGMNVKRHRIYEMDSGDLSKQWAPKQQKNH